MDCKHEIFDATVKVIRMEDIGRFSADVQIKCAQCGHPMRFIGLPMGLDLNGACVSPNGQEARLAIHPAGVAVPNLKEDTPAGFRIFNKSEPTA